MRASGSCYKKSMCMSVDNEKADRHMRLLTIETESRLGTLWDQEECNQFCSKEELRAMMMFCLLVFDSVTSTPQWIRQPRPRVYLKEGTCHARLFRGPSTNDMKK